MSMSDEKLGLFMSEYDKRVEELEKKLRESESRNAELIARNARLSYDLERAYELICTLKGDL